MGLLTEKFASKTLADLARQHGGIKQRINGGMRDGTVSWYADKSMDLATVTDDMLAEPFQYEIPEPNIKRSGDTFIYTEPNGTKREISSKEAYEIMWDYKQKDDEHDRNLTADQKYNMILFNDGWAVALKPYRYHKENGTSEPNRKPSREYSKFGTGIGDTGDHDRTPSPFVNDGGKVQGQGYNAYFISGDAVARRGIRRYMTDLYLWMKKYTQKAEEYKSMAEKAKTPEEYSEYKRKEKEARNDVIRLRKEFESDKPRARELIAQYKPHSVKPIPLKEADLRYIATEATKRLINEIFRNIK